MFSKLDRLVENEEEEGLVLVPYLLMPYTPHVVDYKLPRQLGLINKQ